MFWPNCPCCGCVVASDDFNRTDSSSIGSDWTEAIGNWEIVSNTLRCAATIASNSYAYQKPADVSLETNPGHAVECNVRSSSSGDQVGIVIKHGGNAIGSDAEKTYIRLTVGTSAKLQLFVSRNTGGFVPSIVHESISREISVTAAVDTWHNLRACVSFDGSLAVYLNGDLVLGNDETFKFAREYYTDASGYEKGWSDSLRGSQPCGGVYIGTVSGTPQFDDFIIEKGEQRAAGVDNEWGTVLKNDGCVCEHCVAYEASATVVNEDCSEISGNWHYKGGSTSSLAVDSGRWKFIAVGLNAMQAVRCIQVAPNDSDVDVTAECTIDFVALVGGSSDGLGISVGLHAKNGYRVSIVAHQNAVGAVVGNFYCFSEDSTSIDYTDTSDPASGDVIGVRLYYSGGQFNADYRINGSVIHTETNVSLDIDADRTVALLISVAGDSNAGSSKTAYIDDITVSHGP